MRVAAVTILLVLAIAPLLAQANPGALEINQDCVAVGCFAGDDPGYPVTISASGSYILTSDLAPPGNTQYERDPGRGFSVVDINLNGHTIDGGGTCTGTPVTTCTGFAGSRGLNFSNNGNPGVYHLHDGTVRGFSGGVALLFFSAGDGTVIEHLTVTQKAAMARLLSAVTPRRRASATRSSCAISNQD